MLEYLALIYKNYFSMHKKKVPVVIPIVVYHGTSKWNIEKEFLKFVDIDLEKDADLLKYIPNFFYRIYDIPRMDISFDNYSNELKAFLLTLMIRNKKKQLPELIKILDKVENDDYFLKTLMYILEQLSNEEINRFNDIIKEESIELNRRDEIVTIAQGLREEGKREGILLGIEKGMEKGMEKGIEKGILLSIEKLLKKGMSAKEIENFLDVPHETVMKVKKQIH